MPVVDIETLDREAVAEQSKAVVEAEKQCRIALSADAVQPYIELEWNPGGRNGRRSVIRLERGKSVVQPLSKAQAWFGPFAVPLEYAQTTDERRKENLRQFWSQEKARVLNRYDYARPTSVSKGGYEPIGPHRFPDVTVTIVESDGEEHESIRLHQLYKIGEWDPLRETFGEKESAEQIEARYQAQLDAKDGEVAALRRQVSELAGMVKGVVAASGK